MICEYCQIIESKKQASIIFENEKVLAILSENPSTLGHIILMPKKHYPIIEQVPDYIISHLFEIANKLSIVAFESLNAMGTNIIVNNGVSAGQESSHFQIQIIPRREGDNINFQWQPKQLSQEELSTTELQIKEQTESIGNFEKEKALPINLDNKEEKIEEDNLQVLALDRCP